MGRLTADSVDSRHFGKRDLALYLNFLVTETTTSAHCWLIIIVLSYHQEILGKSLKAPSYKNHNLDDTRR